MTGLYRFHFYCSTHGSAFTVTRVSQATAEAFRALARALHDSDECYTEASRIEADTYTARSRPAGAGHNPLVVEENQ